MKLEPKCIAGIGGLLVLLIVAGCGGVKPAPPAQPPTQSPTQLPIESPRSASQAAVESAAPPAPSPAPASASPPAAATPAATAAAEPAQRPTAAPSTSETVAKATPPAAKAAPKTPSVPAPATASVAQTPKPPPASTETAKPQPPPPPLDLESLETRLKETKAIGVMTKISLKNQVDDLLNQFRAFYAGKLKTSLAELRRPFDLLILKVLSLLQDSDPSLAAAIVASREAIWGILSDPVKFAKLAST